MPRFQPASCSRCTKRRADGWEISRRGLCHACAHAAVATATEAMKSKIGDQYETWRKATAAADRRARRRGVVRIPLERDDQGRWLPRPRGD